MTRAHIDDYTAEAAAEAAGLRIPPHSLEAEQSVLGGLLLDNTAWDRAGDLLTERDFYRFEHRLIFGAIASLINATKPADMITVLDALERAGKAEEVGGLRYLNQLAQSVTSAANMRGYATIVRDHSLRRVLIAAVDNAATVVWNGDSVPPAELLDRVGSIIAGVEQRDLSREPRDLGALLAERLDHYSELSQGDKTPGIQTGLKTLDRALGGGLKPGRLVVLGARPTVGKTSLAGQIASTIAAAGDTVLVLSQEMTAGELVDRFVASSGAVKLEHLATGEFQGEDWSAISGAMERLRKLPLLIDDTPALTLHQMRAKARQVRRKQGLSLVVVDYLQLCAAVSSTDKRHHQIEQISRGLKQLAKELDVTILLLSQINRASIERGEPEMSDLKESGAIEEDADVVLLLHPMGNEPDGSTLLLLKVAKNRQGRRGRIGLNFDGKVQQWEESSSNVDRRPTPARQH